MSQASRSNQSAAFHTSIRLGREGSASLTGTFSRSRSARGSEYRWYTASKRSSRSG